jgi:hypothetical protein
VVISSEENPPTRKLGVASVQHHTALWRQAVELECFREQACNYWQIAIGNIFHGRMLSDEPHHLAQQSSPGIGAERTGWMGQWDEID